MPVRFLRALAAIVLAAAAGCSTTAPRHAPPARHRVIVFVWDGLRPDSISAEDTPHLAALAQRGTVFTDNHSTYPTLTMMNAASFASGARSGASGFFGNWPWRPGVPARNASGAPVDLGRPIFTEDYGILRQLDENQDRHLLLIGSLFQSAQKAGLKTAAIGKSGPAFLQDYKNGGIVLDENAAFPLAFAQELQQAHVALPKTTPNAFPGSGFTLAADNGDPTLQPPLVRMADGVTPDPTDTSGAPPTEANRYLMRVFLDYILPRKQPDLAVVWLRNPDSTEHPYGVGSANYHAALRAQDELLAQLQDRLAALGMAATTDLLIVSDHGHSNVSGPLDLFPPRAIANGKVGAIDRENGFSVSGDVRLAHELTRAGLAAFDGGGCLYDPLLSGIRADGTRLQDERAADAATCPDYKRASYTTPSYDVPRPFLPRGAFVVAANGGSDYLYQPEHDPERIGAAVRFLQGREEFGAIFVDDRYGALPGTLPLSLIGIENAEGRNPDIVVGYTFDENAVIGGMRGIEFEGVAHSMSRGMHGSFSPIDVHNTLIASGPDFRERFSDPLPSANVDVAPTVARILGIELPQAEGRPLLEALRAANVEASSYSVAPAILSPAVAATGLDVISPVGTKTGRTRYTFRVHAKQLRDGDRSYLYFDFARAERN